MTGGNLGTLYIVKWEKGLIESEMRQFWFFSRGTWVPLLKSLAKIYKNTNGKLTKYHP